MDDSFVGAFTAIQASNKRRSSEPTTPEQYPIYHNVFLWFFFGWIVLYIPCIYYTISSKHRWYFISKHEDEWLAQFFYRLFHRSSTANVKVKATPEGIAKLKEHQQRGIIVGKIHYTEPDGTEMTFKSADDLEAYLKSKNLL